MCITKAKLLLLKLLQLFARDVLAMKKLDIEKTKPTLIISVLKIEYKVVLVSSISNYFTNKTSLANKLMIFSNSNLALERVDLFFFYLLGPLNFCDILT